MTTRKQVRKFRKRSIPGYWLVGLMSVGFITQCILVFFATELPYTVVYNMSIVNLISYLGLLGAGLLYMYRRHIFLKLAKMEILTTKIGFTSTKRRHWLFSGIWPTSRQQGGEMENLRKDYNSTIPQHIDEKLRQLKIAVETMRLGVTITDMGGRILYTNPAEATMHGYDVDELIGQDLGIFAPKDLRKPMTPEQIARMRRLRETINIRKDGSIFPVRLMSDVIKDNGGHPIAVVTTCEDITKRKRRQKALKKRTRELTLLNRMGDLLQACDNEEETYDVVGRVCKKLFPSDSGCLCIMNHERTQFNIGAFWGIPPHPSLTPQKETVPDYTALPGMLCPYQNVCIEKDCLCAPINASGEMLGILSLCFRPDHETEHGNDSYYQSTRAKQSVLTRVAEHYALALINLRLREALRMECIRDPLTGLYNRRYMEESLEREARRARRRNTSIGIIMLDIDHFKEFNDRYGHEAGDMVLKELGFFLQQRTRGEDIACRYGGEEFLLILPETPLEIVVQRAKEIHDGVKALKVFYQGQPLQITISAGVAVLPYHSADVREVVTAADAAMYQAKKNGRNQVMLALS